MAKAGADLDSRIGQRLKLRDLHVLAAVARWGSMAKAAPHLAMTQSAVSEAVASLENVLGVKLLDRSPKGVEPTIYAATLLKRSNAVFDELREAIKEIEQLAHSTAGTVRVACPEFLAAGLMTDAVGSFTRRFPDIACHVVEADVSSLDFRQLQERSVDLVVTRVPNGFADEELSVEILFDDPHRIVAGAKNKWARRRDVTLADLAGEPWIVPSSVVVGTILKEAFEADGLQAPDAQVVTSFILMRNHLLATGRFLTVLPDSVLRYNARQWPLRALPIKLRTRSQRIALVSLRNRTISPAVQLFSDHLRAVANDFERGHERISAAPGPPARR